MSLITNYGCQGIFPILLWQRYEKYSERHRLLRSFLSVASSFVSFFCQDYFLAFFFLKLKRSEKPLKSFFMIKPMPWVLSDERVK